VAEEGTPGLDALQGALDAGDIGTVRRQLLTLPDHELALLREDVGAAGLDRALQAASRNRRGERRGKVLVLPGIMGSLLDRVDPRGDAERIWISITQLIGGGMEDLLLTVPDGLPATPGSSVRTGGVHRGTYLPLLTELDAEWDVRPFAFDWREDVAKSATRLEAEVREFGAGGPVHLVAHSMGGLVARYVSRNFAATWTAMDDGPNHAAGGRLVMLGTPNRGSFAPALALTGVDKLVRRLALIDGDHRLPALLAILATFGGLYQMLPSPLVDLGDDHKELFQAGAWPAPVHQALLDVAQKFQVDLHQVIDPDRLVYVAGADRETPARVRTDGGRFSYEFTGAGDGRVPHTLGLLDGVTTYFVDEDHGDLPKNASVLDAIHDLLATGRSTTLSSAPVRRSVDELAVSRRARPVVAEAEDAEVALLVARSRGTGAALTDSERIRLATLVTEDYLGRDGGPPTPPSVTTRQDVPPPVVDVEVVWGDVTKVAADMYSVGHYRGVVPQRAERVLDDAITRAGGRRGDTATGGIIAAQTRRNGIRADVGDIAFFPWADSKRPGRVVAVAGMGSPGTFDAASLRRLVKSAAVAASDLSTVTTWCSVLIGSGEGTLTTDLAVGAWVRGLADAALGAAATGRRPVPKLVIVEMIKGRADRIAACLREEAARLAREDGAIVLETPAKPRQQAGRRLGDEDANQLLLRALAQAASDEAPKALRTAWQAIRDELDLPDFLRAEVVDYVARSANGHEEGGSTSSAIPSRVSFLDGDGVMRVAAIDETATVPERVVPIDPGLLSELVVRMTDPSVDQAHALGGTLYRLAVPADFHPVLSAGGPFVLELDRTTAGQLWEMCRTDEGADAEPLAVRAEVARQLRTTYSPASPRRTGGSSRLRALVIGDPGDPDAGHGLSGAQDEALAVRQVLLAHDVDVDARIGAPSVRRAGKLAGIEPANRLDVLDLLAQGGYDLVHYAGHGDFDPARPDRVGWQFASGLLTSNEIQVLDRAPALIVANACLSARLSTVGADRRTMQELERRALLAPSLADEFLKLGVRDYIGTAWEVNDIGATTFAQRLYTELLAGNTLGHAMREARGELWRSRPTFGSLWAAYQHYGDPNAVLRIAP
jgi:CHAT domain